jgi:hypothetical protein
MNRFARFVASSIAQGPMDARDVVRPVSVSRSFPPPPFLFSSLGSTEIVPPLKKTNKTRRRRRRGLVVANVGLYWSKDQDEGGY